MKQSSKSFIRHLIVFFVLVVGAATSVEAYKATLTMNNFESSGDGSSGPAACDGRYHSNGQRVVALSDKWYEGRCLRMIAIKANGRRVRARVVDKCAGSDGCREDIVDASAAVWDALGVFDDRRGEIRVKWHDV